MFVAALILLQPTLNNTKAAHLNKVAETQAPVAKTADPVPQTPIVKAAEQAPETTPEAPAVVTPAPAPEPQQPTVNLDDHEQLMSLAGIDQKDWAAVDYIISHESSWNPNATEPTTQAHGLPQALPYSKTGCGWTDAICQLQWANSYAIARYGGWWAAQAYWQVHRNW